MDLPEDDADLTSDEHDESEEVSEDSEIEENEEVVEDSEIDIDITQSAFY